MADVESGIVLHAAAVAIGGHGILLPGMAGIGKTMLAAWFLSRGYQYLSDDLVCITDESQQLLALKRPLSIKKSGRKDLESLLRH
jgi:serine kinase of HPr protein (carbohydrate metabolism regulator)